MAVADGLDLVREHAGVERERGAEDGGDGALDLGGRVVEVDEQAARKYCRLVLFRLAPAAYVGE